MYGAGGGSRTHTALRPTDFESAASAIPPLRRVLDSTRHAAHAKALLDGRSVSKLRITRRRRQIPAEAPRATLCPPFPKTHRMRIQKRQPVAFRVVRAPGPPSHWRLGFWSLIVTQFQGAFNDNGLKFLVFYLIVERNFPAQVRDRFILLVGALFAIPFILFSLAGGYFADRYSKRTVTIGTKLFEIGVGLFAIAALAAGNLTMEAAAVFLISTQGALFGPSKYGLLPELLPENKLSWGNGVIELGTFLASITAVMFAGFLADAFRGRHFWSGVIFLGLTMFGLFTSLGISRVPCCRPCAEISSQSVRRSWRTTSHHRGGSRPCLGRGGQYISVVSGRAVAIRDRRVWTRRAACERSARSVIYRPRWESALEWAAWPRATYRVGKSNTAWFLLAGSECQCSDFWFRGTALAYGRCEWIFVCSDFSAASTLFLSTR